MSLLVFYLSAAYVGYLAARVLWVDRADLATVAVGVAVGTLLFAALSYRFGTAGLLASLNAVELPRGRAPEIHRRLDRLAERMGVARPDLYVVRLSAPNALAVGGAGSGAVVLDRSLFGLLTADEIETIVAHELAHLESHDSLVQTLAYSAVRTVVSVLVVAFAPVVVVLAGVARGVAWLVGRPGDWAANPVGRLRIRLGQAVTLLFVALTALVFAHSRRREFAADDRAADVTGNPVALARALVKIERASNPRWRLHAPLYVHTDERTALARLLSTHPAMEDRIERLVERAGRGRQPRR